MNPPSTDPLVEALFARVLLPPEGYSYYPTSDIMTKERGAPISFQLLYPCYGQDKWRLLLKPDGAEELVPVFIEGAFILKLTKALNAMQRELNQAVSDEIPEPVNHARVS